MHGHTSPRQEDNCSEQNVILLHGFEIEESTLVSPGLIPSHLLGSFIAEVKTNGELKVFKTGNRKRKGPETGTCRAF